MGGASEETETLTLPPTPVKQTPPSPPSKKSARVCKKVKEIKIPRNTFVTYHGDKGRKRKHQWRFQILPLSRKLAFPAGHAKLDEYIQKGGGVTVEDQEDPEECLSPGAKYYTIKILDLEYIRRHIQETLVQDLVVPYDCFSSSFIWSKIYGCCSGNKKGNVDLNLYRVGPSKFSDYDANAVLEGSLGWDDIPSLSSAKLPPTITMKHVALQLFPELLLGSCGMGRKTRRFYSRQESQLILDKICKRKAHSQVFGRYLFKDLAKTDFPSRTAESLREHVRRTILPHVLENSGYYILSPEDLLEFQTTFSYDGTRHPKKRKAKDISE